MMCARQRPAVSSPIRCQSVSAGGVAFADVWQYAQSPQQTERTSKCAATYGADGKCYAPGGAASNIFLDLDVATSADPSGGRQ